MRSLSSTAAFFLSLGLCAGQALPERESPRAVGKPELLGGASIVVHVEGKPEITITEDDLSKMARHRATVSEHGKTSEFEGVFLHDVLQRAGAPLGDQLRGKGLSTYILATARDGYAVVYTLTETDTAFSDGDLLLADKSKGDPLNGQQGPFRIIAPHDKKLARSLRMLQRIDVVQLRK
jgi:Oxidoreductase molybdopterin binding domain